MPNLLKLKETAKKDQIYFENYDKCEIYIFICRNRINKSKLLKMLGYCQGFVKAKWQLWPEKKAMSSFSAG